jgi:hypothetical protein
VHAVKTLKTNDFTQFPLAGYEYIQFFNFLFVSHAANKLSALSSIKIIAIDS